MSHARCSPLDKKQRQETKTRNKDKKQRQGRLDEKTKRMKRQREKYDQCQFKAMCALAFFAFLRIGELTSTSKQSPTPLNLNQLTKLLRDGEVIGFKITFTDYKLEL